MGRVPEDPRNRVENQGGRDENCFERDGAGKEEEMRVALNEDETNKSETKEDDTHRNKRG
jgi:hypothetical protein